MSTNHRIDYLLFSVVFILFNHFPSPAQILPNHDSATIAFVSDTQAPLFFERIIRKTNHNEKATELIFNQIITDRPASLFILGDVVSLGYAKKKWNQMDGYLAAYRQNHIPVYAALGNHELLLHAKKGEERFQSRFPSHSPTGYVTVVDSVAVILLNSNFNKMAPAEITRQGNWYAQTISRLNNDPAIRFVIVGCHHSPFTNSKVVAPSAMVQQKFLPLFYASKKCVLFLSGHSHNFERFQVKGKELLVIGGGGGINQSVRTTGNPMPDEAASYKPMFHYLTLKRTNNILTIVSHALKKDFSGFEDGLRFDMKEE